MSGFNAAMVYTIENAIKRVLPDLEIDFTKVLICQGNLPVAINPSAISVLAGKIDFTWDNNSQDFGAQSTDKVVLVAYSPLLGKFVSAIGEATRMQGAQTLTLPESFTGQQVQTYIGFCNTTRTEFSNGEYLAEVVVVQERREKRRKWENGKMD